MAFPSAGTLNHKGKQRQASFLVVEAAQCASSLFVPPAIADNKKIRALSSWRAIQNKTANSYTIEIAM
jgi:hypothetical protein